VRNNEEQQRGALGPLGTVQHLLKVLLVGTVTIAQISDLHIGTKRAGFLRFGDRSDALARCIKKVNAAGPDLVIATGDLTHTGELAEYHRLRELIAELRPPVYLLPGNHDDRQALRTAFSDHAYLFKTSPQIDYTIDAGPVRIIAIDSTEPQRTGGYLDEPRISWLRQRLEETQAHPTIVALHHPPFESGVWPMDSYGFNNVAALEELLKQYAHVQRIVAGHVHCVRSAHIGQALAYTSPPPFTMPLMVRKNARGWLLPARERAGFLLHSCDESNAITTRVVRL